MQKPNRKLLIFQETLTNVARHANANKVDVYLHKNSGQITMRVEDDGKGITDEAILSHRSLGLIGIRERVRPCGGAVNISGDKDKGSTMTPAPTKKDRSSSIVVRRT